MYGVPFDIAKIFPELTLSKLKCFVVPSFLTETLALSWLTLTQPYRSSFCSSLFIGRSRKETRNAKNVTMEQDIRKGGWTIYRWGYDFPFQVPQAVRNPLQHVCSRTMSRTGNVRVSFQIGRAHV